MRTFAIRNCYAGHRMNIACKMVCPLYFLWYSILPLQEFTTSVMGIGIFFYYYYYYYYFFFFFFFWGGAFCADMCFILPWAYMLNILKAMGMVTPHHSQMNGLLSIECAIYRLIKPVAFLGMKTMHTSVMGYIVFLVVASGSINVLSVD